MVGTEDLSSTPLCREKTCRVPEEGKRAKTCEISEDWCGSPVFGAPGTRFSRGDLPPASCICAGQTPNLAAEADGNPTRRGTLVPTDFEGMSSLRASGKPLTSGFVFRRRPRTYEDL